jgi:hypothetical protein
VKKRFIVVSETVTLRLVTLQAMGLRNHNNQCFTSTTQQAAKHMSKQEIAKDKIQ